MNTLKKNFFFGGLSTDDECKNLSNALFESDPFDHISNDDNTKFSQNTQVELAKYINSKTSEFQGNPNEANIKKQLTLDWIDKKMKSLNCKDPNPNSGSSSNSGTNPSSGCRFNVGNEVASSNFPGCWKVISKKQSATRSAPSAPPSAPPSASPSAPSIFNQSGPPPPPHHLPPSSTSIIYN